MPLPGIDDYEAQSAPAVAYVPKYQPEPEFQPVKKRRVAVKEPPEEKSVGFFGRLFGGDSKSKKTGSKKKTAFQRMQEQQNSR